MIKAYQERTSPKRHRFGEDLIKSIKNEKISRLLFSKKSSLLLFEKWGVMCYIDVKLVILSANYVICK